MAIARRTRALYYHRAGVLSRVLVTIVIPHIPAIHTYMSHPIPRIIPYSRSSRPRRRIKCARTYRMPPCATSRRRSARVSRFTQRKNLFIDPCGMTRDAKKLACPLCASSLCSENNIVSQSGSHYVSARATRNIGSGSPRRIMYPSPMEVPRPEERKRERYRWYVDRAPRWKIET